MPNIAKVRNWSVGAIPAGWELIPEVGLKRAEGDAFPSNLVLTEEPLPEGKVLQDYVKNQTEIMQHVLHDPKIEGPDRASFVGLVEALTLRVSYKSENGRSVVQTQVYTVFQELVGIATFTTVEEELPQISAIFKSISEQLRFAENLREK